jgi:hypothetical protein
MSAVAELVWEDPPAEKSGMGYEIASFLKSKPGKWARVRTDVDSAVAGRYASVIRNAESTAFAPVGAFEARAHGRNVYARYVGKARR